MTAIIRRNKGALLRLLLITVLVWIVWLPLVTSGNYRMDSDRIIHTPEIALDQYVREGRSALVLLLRVFGLTEWNPVLSGILYLVFFSAACWILYFRLRAETGWKNGYPELFLLLYALSPVWAYHGYFVLQVAAVGFGMLLTAITACVDVRMLSAKKDKGIRILWEAAALAMLAFSLLIYQTLAVNYLITLAVLLFCRNLRERKDDLRILVRLAVRMVLALAVYCAVTKLLRGNASAGTLTAQVLWKKDSVVRCLFRIAEEIGATMLMYKSRYFSLYTLGAVLLVILWFRRRKTEWKGNAMPVLMGLGMLLLPFCLSVVLGNVTVPRSQFALQMTAAFLPVCFMAETEGKHRVLRAVCVAAVIIQAVLFARLYYTDEVRNRQDTAAAETIAAELAETDPGKPVMFIGVLKMNEGSLLTEKSDVFGRTFFEWVYTPDKPASATQPALRLLTAVTGKEYQAADLSKKHVKQIVKKTADMPCYPEKGFVREEEDCVVVRLSVR